MSNYRLYIDGREADLGDSNAITWSLQRTDYSNPTSVRNTFTKTVKLPYTNNNNQIFNNIWKLDRIEFGGSFNASKRTPFTLTKNGDVMECGYMKLEKINWNGKTYEYEVTLYGELGNILYSLSYKEDPYGNVEPLTLGDLDYGFYNLTIDNTTVYEAWQRLAGSDKPSEKYDIINFAVCYDGVPTLNNFEPKQIWTSIDHNCYVQWDDEHGTFGNLPSVIYEDGDSGQIPYTYATTYETTGDPDDHYALIEMSNGITPLEARDFRSYLLRPVISVAKMFEAIGRYINWQFGYTLDISDQFFNSNDFKKSWITLSMLYEVDPDIESGKIMSFTDILSLTSSPAEYLISYCKIYGIYIDFDVVRGTLTLKRLPRFFENTTEDMKIDLGSAININPLSFDKASYTFDYGDGDGMFLKKYKEDYGITYGSKKINTGYKFSSDSSQYITNNIFREAVDSIDQSVYYRYPFGTDRGDVLSLPVGLIDLNEQKYRLFNIDSDGIITNKDVNMRTRDIFFTLQGLTFIGHSIKGYGYQMQNEEWAGLRRNVWQDGFPKLQFHADGNKATDGKNVLVRFNGMMNTHFGHVVSDDNEAFITDHYDDMPTVQYILSDDNKALKKYTGKNCYYDYPFAEPEESRKYIITIDHIPSFQRCIYDYSFDDTGIYLMIKSAFGTHLWQPSGNNVTIVPSQSKVKTTVGVVGTSGRKKYSCLVDYSGLPSNHKFLILTSVRSNDIEEILDGNNYAYPEILNNTTMIDCKPLSPVSTRTEVSASSYQVVGSIFRTNGSPQTRLLTTLSTIRGNVQWENIYYVVYDLTEMGLDTEITTVDRGIAYFNATPTRIGYNYKMVETFDFSVTREIYVPACVIEDDSIGIYSQCWNNFISDVYSVNTRVLECICYIDDIRRAFHKFFYYQNCLWVLSKVSDWNMDSKRCKAVFLKVNSKANYLNSAK